MAKDDGPKYPWQTSPSSDQKTTSFRAINTGNDPLISPSRRPSPSTAIVARRPNFLAYNRAPSHQMMMSRRLPDPPTKEHDPDHDPDYDLSDGETRGHSHPSPAENRPLGQLTFRPSPLSTRHATPVGSGDDVQVQLSSPISGNIIIMAKPASQLGETPTIGPLIDRSSLPASQMDSPIQSTLKLKKPVTHLATSNESTPVQTASANVHTGSKIDRSGGGAALVIELSSGEEEIEDDERERSGAEEDSQRGPQTQPVAPHPSLVAINPAFASKADEAFVARVMKGYDDARETQSKKMAQRDEGITEAQTAHNEAIAEDGLDEIEAAAGTDEFADADERATVA